MGATGSVDLILQRARCIREEIHLESLQPLVG